MKSDRLDLPLTIATLVRDMTPVTPLEAPAARLGRWAVTSSAFVLLSVVILGVRTDVAAQVVSGWFVARATATLALAVGAALVALWMGVPGGEPSLRLRAWPLSAGLVWAGMLAGAIAVTPSPFTLLLHVPPHPSCVLFIVTTAVAPGVILVRLLRRAAPLQPRWAGGTAGLASLALGALATQFVCRNDAAAHHLLWHFAPVVLLTLAAFSVSWSRLERGRRSATDPCGMCRV
jgi:hypothetical protein